MTAKDTPMSPPDEQFHHPRQHSRALRSALLLGGGGVLVWAVGLAALIAYVRSGLVISLMVVGITMMILAPVWYFTLMEKLEPELYRHDK